MAPDWADRYNGQQGDIWDPQKDMALALLGATLSTLVSAWFQTLRRSKATSRANGGPGGAEAAKPQ